MLNNLEGRRSADIGPIMGHISVDCNDKRRPHNPDSPLRLSDSLLNCIILGHKGYPDVIRLLMTMTHL